MSLPKLIVFDLDGTLWTPDMYMLWGGGAPFTAQGKGAFLTDRKGSKVTLCGDSLAVMEELHAARNGGADVTLALASTCDEPAWAQECLTRFVVAGGEMGDVFQHHEIYNGCDKKTHFRNLHKKLAGEVSFDDMVFFDNQMNNISCVGQLGVHCVFAPDGITRAVWDQGIADWRKKQA
jgi:magnesium-dependent phosphatase 1